MSVRSTRSRRPMRPSTPAPPPVGEALPEDVETLRIHLKLARAQNAALYRELATALKHGPVAPTDVTTEEALHLEADNLRQRLATLTLHYQDRQMDVVNLRQQLAFAHQAMGWMPVEVCTSLLDPSSAVEALLTRLLIVAHPDKWSQGQPATELAHELTVAITALRQTMA